MWGFLILFGLLAIGLFYEKAEGKAEEKAYNNGYCSKCGEYMSTIHDQWGNSIGFGCSNCGHRTSDRYIGSEFQHLRKK